VFATEAAAKAFLAEQQGYAEKQRQYNIAHPEALEGQAGYEQAQADYAAAHAQDYQVTYEAPSGEKVTKGFSTEAAAQKYVETLPKATVTYVQPRTGKTEVAAFQSAEQAKIFSEQVSALSAIGGTYSYYETPSGARYPVSHAGREAAFMEMNRGADFSGKIPGGTSKPITFYPSQTSGAVRLGDISAGSTPAPKTLSTNIPTGPTIFGVVDRSALRGKEARSLDITEPFFEGIAEKYRVVATSLQSVGEEKKAAGDIGAIPFFIAANLEKAGAGFIEGITFPLRPAQWVGTVKTFATAEGRGELVKAAQQNPVGFIMEAGGAVLGGMAFGKIAGKASDVLKGTKMTLRSIESVEVKPVAAEAKLGMGEAKIPDYTQNVPSLAKTEVVPTIAEKTFRTKIPLREQLPDISGMGKDLPLEEPISGVIGYDIKSPVKGASLLKFAPDEISKLYEGKPFEVTGLKTSTLSFEAAVTPEIGVQKISGLGEARLLPYERVTSPNIFSLKELGPEGSYGAFSEAIATPVEPAASSFKLKVIAGFKEEAPLPETSMYKPPADIVHTPLSKTFGKIVPKETKPPAPAPTTPAIAESVAKTGKITPMIRASYYPASYASEGAAVGFVSGLTVRQPSITDTTIFTGTKTVTIPSTLPDVKSRLTPLSVQVTSPVSEQSQRVAPIQVSGLRQPQIQTPRLEQPQITKLEQPQVLKTEQSQALKQIQPQIQMPKFLSPPTPLISKVKPLMPSFMEERKSRPRMKMGLDLFGRKRVTYGELDLPTAVFGRRRK
jgi:hypothetical protein